MTLDALKEAIAGLPATERMALATWLNEQAMDEWGRQMQNDFSPSGKGMQVVERVKAYVRAGKFSPTDANRT